VLEPKEFAEVFVCHLLFCLWLKLCSEDKIQMFYVLFSPSLLVPILIEILLGVTGKWNQ